MSYQQNPYGQQNPYDNTQHQTSYGQYGGNPYASEGYGQQQNPYGGQVRSLALQPPSNLYSDA